MIKDGVSRRRARPLAEVLRQQQSRAWRLAAARLVYSSLCPFAICCRRLIEHGEARVQLISWNTSVEAEPRQLSTKKHVGAPLREITPDGTVGILETGLLGALIEASFRFN
eukprot:5961052-Amphidinium_carterae.2